MSKIHVLTADVELQKLYCWAFHANLNQPQNL